MLSFCCWVEAVCIEALNMIITDDWLLVKDLIFFGI